MANDLERFTAIFGSVFDSMKTEVERLLGNYQVEDCDSSLLPYIDALLGWPTNFDLDERHRRQETLAAVTLWKRKGRKDALTAFVEGIANWNASAHDGWPFVMMSNTARCTTPVPATVQHSYMGTLLDTLFYTPTQQSWHCLNGMVLRMEPIAGITPELSSITMAKIEREAPKLIASWALLGMIVVLLDEEEVDSIPAEDSPDALYNYEGAVVSPGEVYADTWGPETLLMVSNESSRTSNNVHVRTHHAGLGYAGPPPPAPYP